MKFPMDMKARMEAYETHPATNKTLAAIDRFIQLLTQKQYRGQNPAIASVYAPLRAGIVAVTAIVLITLIFGVLAPLDSAAIAKGTVVVMSKRKTVQHLEGGIVKKILVEEGQLVKKDQPLMELSDVAPKANREMVQQELRVERAAESRLLALQNNTKLSFPDELQEAAETAPELLRAIQTQTELFKTQQEAQNGKLKTLKQRIAQLQEEILGLEAQVSSADGQLKYTQEEIASVSSLLKEGLATKPRLLALQRQAEELRGGRGQNVAQIAKARQAITESELSVINQQNDFASDIARELHDVRSKIADYEEKLHVADDVMARTTVLAPTEGVVTGLKYHTIGGVVPPGAPIMDIVPQTDTLIIEVHIQPTDIDVVKQGLNARVIFPAYKARRMPLFHGTVTQVSADAFNEQLGAQTISYYTARIEVDGKQLHALPNTISLTPGMPADVYIRTGSRSFIGYLFAPLSDSMEHAFKEE